MMGIQWACLPRAIVIQPQPVSPESSRVDCTDTAGKLPVDQTKNKPLPVKVVLERREFGGWEVLNRKLERPTRWDP